MYFIGIDLAWGEVNPTGVAVLDEAGRLVHLASVRTDEQVLAGLAAYTQGDCLVAIDAPLIVPNDTGNRPAERALNKDFAKFDAGAHPVNKTMPTHADTPRATRLATALSLTTDPAATTGRRAIEVYPHPATIALFRLGRTLKYKQKSRRSFPELREALSTLVGLLTGLVAHDPPLRLADNDVWQGLVSGLETATRKSHLRFIEDQVDAVLCAYVALFRERRPAEVTTYGDHANGYIVTPTLPTDLKPTPRAPRPTPAADSIARAVSDYAAQQPHLRTAAEQAINLVTGILDEAGINYLSVTGRAKGVASYAAKAARLNPDGTRAFTDPATQIGDTIGIRVITYVHSDVDAVAALLGDELTILDDRDLGVETASEGRFGYASRHLQIGVPEPTRADYPAIGERQVQVQIRTVLQHAWAEFEHDIRYKGTIPDEHRPDFDRRFTLAAGLLELADREFSTIRQRLQHATTPDPAADLPAATSADDPRISTQELAAFLAGQYADADWSRTDHYAWISGLVLELGITSLAELADVIRTIDIDAINTAMGYRHPTGAVRRLDDALLAAYGDRYVGLHGNAHRIDRLKTRLTRFPPQPVSEARQSQAAERPLS